jgi:hypothetical protein
MLLMCIAAQKAPKGGVSACAYQDDQQHHHQYQGGAGV